MAKISASQLHQPFGRQIMIVKNSKFDVLCSFVYASCSQLCWTLFVDRIWCVKITWRYFNSLSKIHFVMKWKMKKLKFDTKHKFMEPTTTNKTNPFQSILVFFTLYSGEAKIKGDFNDKKKKILPLFHLSSSIFNIKKHFLSIFFYPQGLIIDIFRVSSWNIKLLYSFL